MRLAVFSDTHGRPEAAAELADRLGPVDWLLHAGDHWWDAPAVAAALQVPTERVVSVAGNCDGRSAVDRERVVELGGVRIWLTHGHLHDVKWGYQRLCYGAAELAVQAVVFGHTHVPLCRSEGDLLLFNPGSLAEPRRGGRGTCGLLQIELGQVTGQILSL